MESLPDELLIAIFKAASLSKWELAKLCLTCRRVRGIAADLLYRRITIKRSRGTLQLLLRSVARNPALVLLVKHLVVDWKSIASTPELCTPQSCHLQIHKHWKSLPFLFPHLAKGVGGRSDVGGSLTFDHVACERSSFSTIAQSHGMENKVIQSLYREYPDARAFLLLLYILRNLRTLKAGFPSDDIEFIFLREIIGGNIMPDLQSLKRIDGGSNVNVRLFLRILLAPSLHTVWVVRAIGYDKDDYDIGMAAESPISQYFGTSNVTFIGLDNSYLPASALSVLCRLPKALRELRYGHYLSKSQVSITTIESVGKAIQYASASLERLAIRYSSPVDNSLVGSFRSFKALKVLVIPPHILLRPDLNSNPPFAALLPIGLEKLTFSWSEWPLERVIEAIRRLIEEKQSYFPRLVMIATWMVREFDLMLRFKTLCDLASPLGIELGVADDRDPLSVVPLDSIDIGQPRTKYGFGNTPLTFSSSLVHRV
jgi:hypothetical protein